MTTEDEKDVHTEHCCAVHGCKYGFTFTDEDKCTVATGKKRQSGMDEWCWNEIWEEGGYENAVLMNEMYDKGFAAAVQQMKKLWKLR